MWQREITAEHRAAAIPAAAPVAAPAPAPVPVPVPAAAATAAAPADPASAPWFALDDLSLACHTAPAHPSFSQVFLGAGTRGQLLVSSSEP